MIANSILLPAAVKLIPTAATKKSHHKPKEITIQDTVQELQTVSAEMEQLYPNLFKDVFTQLNIRVTSEEVVEEAVTAVASEIFRSGITWARVVAMFAVAATLAAECVQQRSQDHAAFVDRVVRSLSNFVRENLAEWIAGEGGWVGAFFFKTSSKIKEEEQVGFQLCFRTFRLACPF